MACAHRLSVEGRGLRDHTDRSRPGAGLCRGGRRGGHLLRALSGWGVEIVENNPPVEVLADAVLLESGRRIAADITIGAAGGDAAALAGGRTGLDTQEGFVVVDQHLRSTSHPDALRRGRLLRISRPDPRPKAGVYAVRGRAGPLHITSPPI